MPDNQRDNNMPHATTSPSMLDGTHIDTSHFYVSGYAYDLYKLPARSEEVRLALAILSENHVELKPLASRLNNATASGNDAAAQAVIEEARPKVASIVQDYWKSPSKVGHLVSTLQPLASEMAASNPAFGKAFEDLKVAAEHRNPTAITHAREALGKVVDKMELNPHNVPLLNEVLLKHLEAVAAAPTPFPTPAPSNTEGVTPPSTPSGAAKSAQKHTR